ncbi:MAG TPA: response regulator transcription factor [Candidatus Acidoferrum sp.]|nr:response regulator transcription factor [Candidatus Acidoferrum sp.]
MRVLIVDDHPIVRAGLRRLLSAHSEIEVRDATTGKEALALVRDYHPDIVMLDLNLPGIGGLEIISRLKLEEPAAKVLVFTMHDNAVYVTRALQAGATGYVSKNAPPEEILEAIRRVGSGRSYIEQAIAQELAILNVRTPAHALKDLSRRDLEILRLLGEGHSLSQIADIVGVSYKTVANNCTQIKAKLGVDRIAELIRIAVLYGISDGGAIDGPAPPDEFR